MKRSNHPSFLNSYLYNPIRGYVFKWPYIAFSGLDGFLWIICAFDQEFMKRVEYPKHDGLQLVQTFITYDFNLFIVLQSEKLREFQILKLDLNYPNDFKTFDEQRFILEPVLTYKSDDVGGQPLTDLYIRSESREVGSNEKLMCFLLHRNKLFSWVAGNAAVQLLSEVENAYLTSLDVKG